MSASVLDDFGFEPHPDWRELAACRGEISLFFARKAERPEARERRETKARRLCEACSVSTVCREWARVHREYGFWGGESEEDRHHAGYTLSAPIGVPRPRRSDADEPPATAC